MAYTLHDVYITYVRLYGEDKKDDIARVIEQAKQIAKNTGEDEVLLAEQMLSDELD